MEPQRSWRFGFSIPANEPSPAPVWSDIAQRNSDVDSLSQNEENAYRHAQSRRINGRDQTVDEARNEELAYVAGEVNDAATSVLGGSFSDARQHLGYALHAVQDEKHEWTPYRLHQGNGDDIFNPVGREQDWTDVRPTTVQRRQAELRTRETIARFEARIRELGRKKGLSEKQIQALIDRFRAVWENPFNVPKPTQKEK